MSEWMPISTAPKAMDVEIDLWAVRDHRIAGHQERRWCYASWWPATEFADGQARWMIEEEDGALAIDDWSPTHWMPLPDPPKGTGHE